MSAASLLALPKSSVLVGSFVMKWDEAIKELEIGLRTKSRHWCVDNRWPLPVANLFELSHFLIANEVV
jgi:hypothetical protein